jgi:hypothetical protein
MELEKHVYTVAVGQHFEYCERFQFPLQCCLYADNGSCL